jgi:predicted alpha/beta hydrolase family esterase
VIEGTAVFVAGINNSGPEHWQRHFSERLPGSVWVEHDDWDAPQAADWVAELQASVKPLEGPLLFIAHSLGCLLVTEWAKAHPGRDFAAFMVAPPDPDGPAYPRHLVRGFAPGPQTALDVPVLVLASQDDPYGSLDYARACAKAWSAPLIDVGAKGHINAASGLERWPEGWGHLQAFLKHDGSR